MKVDRLSPNQINFERKLRQRGQVVVEYVLLLIIAVAIAGLVMRSCVSRDESDPGVVVQFWDQVLTFVGSDQADEP